MKRILTVLCLVALCAFMGINTMAQSTTGNLIGTVVDPDGKAVVGATVTVTDSNTNASLPPVKTGDGGRFAVSELPPGHYKVSVSMANFKTTVDNDVEIITARTYELPVKLEVGGANVEVDVDRRPTAPGNSEHFHAGDGQRTVHHESSVDRAQRAIAGNARSRCTDRRRPPQHDV